MVKSPKPRKPIFSTKKTNLYMEKKIKNEFRFKNIFFLARMREKNGG